MRYNAAAFLENLFRPQVMPHLTPSSGAATIPVGLPAEWQLAWDERAAIMEYDGGLPRVEAEAWALAEIIKVMNRAGHPPSWPI
jgi:hypothetical protein